MKKLVWHNRKVDGLNPHAERQDKVYDHATILKRVVFINKHMKGLLPIGESEKKILERYAEEHELPVYEMLSMRNALKVQQEINSSKKFHFCVDKIKNKFINLTKEQKNGIVDNMKIRIFFESVRMPFHYILRTIEKLSEYNKLNEDNHKYIQSIRDTIYQKEVQVRENSEAFEHALENYLKSNDIQFRTEIDIKKIGDYNVTPDILLDEPIILKVNDNEYKIKWMDAKNYILIDVPFIIKSLHKQANKYNEIFGLGAFVFHYGLDSSISIPNAIILDGSFL